MFAAAVDVDHIVNHLDGTSTAYKKAPLLEPPMRASYWRWAPWGVLGAFVLILVILVTAMSVTLVNCQSESQIENARDPRLDVGSKDRRSSKARIFVPASSYIMQLPEELFDPFDAYQPCKSNNSVEPDLDRLLHNAAHFIDLKFRSVFGQPTRIQSFMDNSISRHRGRSTSTAAQILSRYMGFSRDTSSSSLLLERTSGDLSEAISGGRNLDVCVAALNKTLSTLDLLANDTLRYWAIGNANSPTEQEANEGLLAVMTIPVNCGGLAFQVTKQPVCNEWLQEMAKGVNGRARELMSLVVKAKGQLVVGVLPDMIMASINNQLGWPYERYEDSVIFAENVLQDDERSFYDVWAARLNSLSTDRIIHDEVLPPW